MSGTRRGLAGSGRPTRAKLRPEERRALYLERMSKARNDRERVSIASQFLRAALADPHVTDEQGRQVADQAVRYLAALAEQLQTDKNPRGER